MACQAKTIPSDARASFCLPVKFVDEDTRKHLYLNHLSVEGFAVAFCLPFHQPSIRPNHGHDSSIRSPNPMLGARALNSILRPVLSRPGAPASCSRCERPLDMPCWCRPPMCCRQNAARRARRPPQPHLPSRLLAIRRWGSSGWNFGWMAQSEDRP
jgi:hypothetical protein